MRLVYKGTDREVKVGDTVVVDATTNGRVHFFRPPHKPSSEGHVSVMVYGQVREYYVSVIGAEWIEREDRKDFDEIGVDNDGNAICWNAQTQQPYNSGEPPEQLPAGNLGIETTFTQPFTEPLPVYTDDDAMRRSLKPGLYLGLFHGRNSPTEELNDWGFDGPVIGPLKYVQTTYANRIAFEFEDHEDWKRYFPDRNVVSSFSHGPGVTHLEQGEIGPFDSQKGGWPKLNDPAVRQDLIDRGLVRSFTFKTEGELDIVSDGLVEFRGKFYGDWTVFVAGNVLPTAAQMAEELRDRPDLHQRVIEVQDKANDLHSRILRLIEEVRS